MVELWGIERYKTQIDLGGLEFSVTFNLSSALYHLRLHDEPRIL
jgi:hypothetical protein